MVHRNCASSELFRFAFLTLCMGETTTDCQLVMTHGDTVSWQYRSSVLRFMQDYGKGGLDGYQVPFLSIEPVDMLHIVEQNIF